MCLGVADILLATKAFWPHGSCKQVGGMIAFGLESDRVPLNNGSKIKCGCHRDAQRTFGGSPIKTSLESFFVGPPALAWGMLVWLDHRQFCWCRGAGTGIAVPATRQHCSSIPSSTHLSAPHLALALFNAGIPSCVASGLPHVGRTSR